VLHGDIICYVDGDTENFEDWFVIGMVGVLLKKSNIEFVKGFSRRPFKSGDTVQQVGGGRVTELVAKPILNLFYPELTGISQPLSGEIAAKRSLLTELGFVTGYGVEIGHLIDVYKKVGLEKIAQVDLEVRQNKHQSLSALVPMAHAVLTTVMH